MTQTQKSTVDEIRQRFDANVERFANLDTGQSAAIDSPLCLELVTAAAAAATPAARSALDVGCGAGNYTLKLLERLPRLEVALVDLSRPMLDRALARTQAAGALSVAIHQADIRELSLPAESFDIALAAAVLHHLRTDNEWAAVFGKLYRALRPGGSLWIVDLVDHESVEVRRMMQERYGDYLTELGGGEYRDRVLEYVEREDTPRSLTFQISLLREVGFREIDVLHKNVCFAAFGGVKR